MARYDSGKPELKCNNCFSVFTEVRVLSPEELTAIGMHEMPEYGDVYACPNCSRRFRIHGPDHNIIVYGTGRERGEDGIEWLTRP